MERLLHYAWQNKLFPIGELHTTDGQTLEVINTGLHNTDSGPDFINCTIKLDGVECKITFALSIMKITTARDFKAVEKEVRRIMKIVEPESSIKEIR